MKSAQVAGRLLRLAGGQMPRTKLAVFFYVIDRTALGRWGRSVAHDTYRMTPHGPVPDPGPSHLQGVPFDESLPDRQREHQEGAEQHPQEDHWKGIAVVHDGQTLRLVGPTAHDQLSEVEEDLIAEVHFRHGRRTSADLLGLLGTFGELGGVHEHSAPPIDVAEILFAQGYSSQETADVLTELRLISLTDRLTA